MADGRLYVTSGDISGIGPEVVAKAILQLHQDELARITIIDAGHCIKQLLGTCVQIDWYGLGQEVPYPAQDPKLAAQLAWDSLLHVAQAVQKEKSGAVATGPVHKHRLKQIGFSYPGQTEFFADIWGGVPIMMLSDGQLHVVPATIHMPLKDVPKALSIKQLKQIFLGTAQAAKMHLGIARPRIAICGLNPHAGEQGHFGDEEQTMIIPAIQQAQESDQDSGFDGPLAADSLFLPHRRDGYDVIIGMYHDQVLAPFKAVAFEHGVNATLGLTYLRTAPDHGTADDIAGKGLAQHGPMLAAMRMALRALT